MSTTNRPRKTRSDKGTTRLPAEERRTGSLILRASPDDLALLDELAGLWGLPRAAAVRRAVADALAREHGTDASAARAPPVDLADALLAALRSVDARERCGGLVPLPRLRAELVRAGVSAGRAEVDAAILDLQRARRLDCKIANDPRALGADDAEGIEVAGRGLVFYLVARDAPADEPQAPVTRRTPKGEGSR